MEKSMLHSTGRNNRIFWIRIRYETQDSILKRTVRRKEKEIQKKSEELLLSFTFKHVARSPTTVLMKKKKKLENGNTIG